MGREMKEAAGQALESAPAAEEGARMGAGADCSTAGAVPESRRRQGIITVAEAARYSGLCLRSVKKLVADGVLHAFAPYGLERPLLVYRADVDAVMRGERP